MKIIVRKALPSDAESITRLSHQLGYSVSPNETEKHILSIAEHPDHETFVALFEDTVMGWIHIFYTLRIETDPFAEIGGMVVDENYRSKHIGASLVKNAIEWAAEKNAHTLRVRCNTLRKDAHRFYTAQGFTVSKEQKVFVRKLPE